MVGRLCRQLDRERISFATVFAALLRAALAHQQKNAETAASQLRAAIEAAEADMPLHSACARRCLGAIVGGDEGGALVSQADASMNAQGIVCPERFVRLIAPGFG